MSLTRVMVILPFYGGSLPVGRYCADALREAECLVDVFEAPSFYPAFQAFRELKVAPGRQDYLVNHYLNIVGDAIQLQADRFQPDLVLCMAQAPVSQKLLRRLKQDGVLTAMWFVEDYNLFTYWRTNAAWFDIFAVIQKEPFLALLEETGVEHTLYLPLAAQPTVHRPLALTEEEKRVYGSELSFMGAGYPNRRRVFRELTRYDLKIWGTEWEGDAMLEPLVQRGGARLAPQEYVKVFNASDININLHSSVRTESLVSGGDFVNPRTFEVAACGAFQLVDRRTLMPELFRPDELAVFDDVATLKDMIGHYLAEPEERSAMAGRARCRVLQDHTYKARMVTLLEFAKQRFAGWPAARDEYQWPEDMPADLQKDLEKLMRDLALPQGTDFYTLADAVRAKSGVLTPAESAILFLSEWKKQFAG